MDPSHYPVQWFKRKCYKGSFLVLQNTWVIRNFSANWHCHFRKELSILSRRCQLKLRCPNGWSLKYWLIVLNFGQISTSEKGVITKWIRFLIRQIYTSSTKSTYFWLIQTFLIRNHSYKRFQIKLDLNELSRYDMICILLSLSCLWQVFFKYICSFFARNFVVGFMLQCFYVPILFSRLFLRSKSVQKCSTAQSFTFPKFTSFKLGTLVCFLPCPEALFTRLS